VVRGELGPPELSAVVRGGRDGRSGPRWSAVEMVAGEADRGGPRWRDGRRRWTAVEGVSSAVVRGEIGPPEVVRGECGCRS
jgi:hypothetical protein